MDDTGAMRLVERIGRLNRDRQRLIDGHPAFPQAIRQRLAFEILQHEEIDPVLMPDIVQGADVRMIQGGDGARLALEALAGRGIAADMRGEDLDRNHSIESRVARAIDLPHAAGPKGRYDFV
jgi:hypothetical protein